eukprot:1146145-Pelagomonas_calceolata.AAC.3
MQGHSLLPNLCPEGSHSTCPPSLDQTCPKTYLGANMWQIGVITCILARIRLEMALFASAKLPL